VLITCPERMRELNLKWRGEDRTVRIISFPQGSNPGPYKVLGDIAIQYDGQGFPDDLLVHGILHLLGHKHDTVGRARKMEKHQAKVMETLCG